MLSYLWLDFKKVVLLTSIFHERFANFIKNGKEILSLSKEADLFVTQQNNGLSVNVQVKRMLINSIKMNKNVKILLVQSFVFLGAYNNHATSHLFREVKYQDAYGQAENISVPKQRTQVWNIQSEFGDRVINHWSSRSLAEIKQMGKVGEPRVLLANLISGENISETNAFIRGMQVNGVSGSKWALNKNGDYDFPLTILTTILWKFGDQPTKLYPATATYMLHVLMTESGNKFRYATPKTMGLVRETENHILMTEGSRYLKNRWLTNHGHLDLMYNNSNNGMEQKLLDVLAKMKTNGLYEFNSLPYIGYTITALLNLESFGSDAMQLAARDVLDYMNWCYALGSYQFKHYPPMRRRYEKAGIQEITTDYHSLFMKAWLSYSPLNFDASKGQANSPHSLMAVTMPYRPADQVVKLLNNKGNGYYVKLGHGPRASPEIYSAGKHFLLSAGGVNRGEQSLIVARPICLFLNDQATQQSETFNLAGPGTDFKGWNNTGVYKNFACAAGPVHIPINFKAVDQKANWSMYELQDGVVVMVYSTAQFGLIAIFENSTSTNLFDQTVSLNANEQKINTSFQFPNGEKIGYDVRAAKSTWVIQSVNEQPQNRNFDQWPLIDGDLPY